MIVVPVLTLTDDDNVHNTWIFNNNNTQMSLLGIKNKPFAIASTFSYAFKKRIGFDIKVLIAMQFGIISHLF